MRTSGTLLLCLMAFSIGTAEAQPVNALWAVDFSGTVHSITKLDPAGSILTTTPLGTNFPFGMAVDPLGNVWAGSNGTQVVKLDSGGNVLGTFTVGSFPQSVASDAAGNIWVVNRSGNSVMKLDNAGNVLVTTPLPSGTSPIGVIVDQTGSVWASGFHSSTSTMHSLFKLDSAGNITNTFTYGPSTSGGFGFSFPSVDRGNDIWVANQARRSILQIDQAGNILTETAGLATTAPRGNMVDGLDFCWLAVQGFAGNCLKIDQNGVIVQTILPPATSFTTCAIDGYGDPWVFGFSSPKAIKMWQVDGTILATVPLPAGGSAWGGDVTGFHNAANLNPAGDFDLDGATNLAEVVAGTNPLEIRSTPVRPLPIQSGMATPGATVRLGVRLRAAAGQIYVMAASLGNAPGITLPDSRVIPLNPDALFFLSFVTPAIFKNFAGVLNATGDALPAVNIPSDPALIGLSFYVAFILLDPVAPSGIGTISNDLQLTIA